MFPCIHPCIYLSLHPCIGCIHALACASIHPTPAHPSPSQPIPPQPTPAHPTPAQPRPFPGPPIPSDPTPSILWRQFKEMPRIGTMPMPQLPHAAASFTPGLQRFCNRGHREGIRRATKVSAAMKRSGLVAPCCAHSVVNPKTCCSVLLRHTFYAGSEVLRSGWRLGLGRGEGEAGRAGLSWAGYGCKAAGAQIAPTLLLVSVAGL